MTRSELVEKLYERSQDNIDYETAENSSKIIFDSLIDALTKGDRVEIRGFGSFSLRQLKAHTARNPKTGVKVEVGRRFSVYFRPGKLLKDKVNVHSYND